MKLDALISGFAVIWVVLFPLAVIRAIKRIKKADVANLTLTDEQHTERMARVAPFMVRIKFIGWWFFILGGFLLLTTIPPLSDPNAPVMVNGEPRSELWIKMLTFSFTSIFPIIGAIAIFTPKEKMADHFVVFQGLTERFYKAQKLK